jgi:hypothetical protein
LIDAAYEAVEQDEKEQQLRQMNNLKTLQEEHKKNEEPIL